MVTREEARHFQRENIAIVRNFVDNWTEKNGRRPSYAKIGLITDGQGESVWMTEDFSAMQKCSCGCELRQGCIENPNPAIFKFEFESSITS